MNTLVLASVLLVIACLSCGCTGEIHGEDIDDEQVAEAEGAVLAANALAPGALAPGALAPNALAPGALAPNALAPGALAPAAMAAIQAATADGDAARALVKYAVSCALPPGQSFDFSWQDSSGAARHESYPGLLGLAPEWATGPLADETRKRLVSGCLAARVNHYGVQVIVSVRSLVPPLEPPCDSQELVDYPHVEGAFWGNLFTNTPYLSACHDADNVAVSRQAMRDCAVGHLSGGQTVPCGIIVLRGPCSEWCQTESGAGQYYSSCVDEPDVAGSPATNVVITTALP